MCTVNEDTQGYVSGCQVPVGNGICGETNTLGIIEQFKRLYEDKMRQIDAEAGGDYMQEKINLQQEWIGDLTEQNVMLVRAVEELEYEATQRVQMLEEKLQHSAQCICEVMKKYREHDITSDLLAEPLQKIAHLESDVKNLIEFIRRVRENDDWSVDGLVFYQVDYKDILGPAGVLEKCKQKCGNKNNLLLPDPDEGEKLLNEKDRQVRDLQGRVDYFNSFGNIEEICKELNCRKLECENLKQEMGEVRQALTEEVAHKHDQIMQLKRDVQDLEDRCIQADKQTAFRDEIIKELKKEIKQLKQQVTREEITMLNSTIDELRKNLTESKILQEDELRSKEEEVINLHHLVNQLRKENKVQVSLQDDGQSEISSLTIKKKEETIKVQNETLCLVQNELEDFKKKEQIILTELQLKNAEIQSLQEAIGQLQNSLKNTEERAHNLQVAVDLYTNSVSVLESSELKYKLEIDQQKQTISNLQEALVTAKKELDELNKKGSENVEHQNEIVTNLSCTLVHIQDQLDDVNEQWVKETKNYKRMQNKNLELEIEYCNSLQDVSILKNYLENYRNLVRNKEEEITKYKHELKNLMKQKKCYEEVVVYFKDEMSAMSEQFDSLHALLTSSIQSAQEENCRLSNAFSEVQKTNEKLSRQLCSCQQKAQCENEQSKQKICELECLLQRKDLDLSKHNETIKNIRKSLQCSLKQNEELHNTVVSLNQTIFTLQQAVQSYEVENCRTKQSAEHCRSQIDNCRERLVDLKNSLNNKTTELLKLEMAYNNQNRQLKVAQSELEEMKSKQSADQCHLICAVEELEKKMADAEELYSSLYEEHNKVQSQLATVTRREAVKDLEIKRYRQIVGDLKCTLMELNKSLTNKELRNKCKNEECRKNMDLVDQAKNQKDICYNCPCEVEFYQSIVETLKKSVVDLKKRLNESQQENKQLKEDKKSKEVQFEQLSRSQLQRDREFEELREKLSEKMMQAQKEEARYAELAAQLEKEIVQTRQELQIKTNQLEDMKRNVKDINSSKCIQMACAQEEINSLKEELNKMMQKHCVLNCENEKLHLQSAQLQHKVRTLEEGSQLLKEQVEQYLAQLQHVHVDKQALIRKNREMLAELKAIQGCCEGFSKQQRDIQSQCSTKSRRTLSKSSCAAKSVSPPPTCQSPWGLGSQGTGSLQDPDSPCSSPCPDDMRDWYSPTFRNESDEEYEEDWVSKLENLTSQVRRTNRMWENERKLNNKADFVVSKDYRK